MGSGVVGLHLKGVGTWLNLREAVLPRSAKSQISNHTNIENKKTWLIQLCKGKSVVETEVYCSFLD